MLKKLFSVAIRYHKKGQLKMAQLMDELIKKYAEFGEHYIKEWDGTIERVNVISFNPDFTIIEYEDGVRNEVSTLHFLQDLYMGPAKDEAGANLRHWFRDMEVGLEDPVLKKKKEYIN